MSVQASKTSTGNIAPVVRLKFDDYAEYMAIEAEATKAGAKSIEAYIRQILKNHNVKPIQSITSDTSKLTDKKDGKEKVSS